MRKMWYLNCAFFAILFMLCEVGTVNSLAGVTPRCNETTQQRFSTTCRPCFFMNRAVSCPVGTRKLTTVRCRLFSGWLPGLGLTTPSGCAHLCERTIVKQVCCPGFWGQDCRPCPGIEAGEQACYGMGRCSDRSYGNGTCSCNAGFKGFACEKCFDRNKYGPTCRQDCTCKNGTCNSGVRGDGKCQLYTCKAGYYGDNCEKFEQKCNNTCHSNAHCVVVSQITCKCNPGYSGDGTHCEEIDPCKIAPVPCPSNSVCRHTGPGLHQCSCGNGYTGDGYVCTAIDYCQYNNGNCSNNTQCNYQGPGKFNCSCLPGYGNYTGDKGCTVINLCSRSGSDCPALYSECYMVKPNKKSCRCKSGFIGNGTKCYGNILQTIYDMNRDGKYKNQLIHAKNLIVRHPTLSRPFTSEGPFTVFIPTDSGIENNLTNAQRERIYKDKELGYRIVLHHCIFGLLSTSDLARNGNVTTLKGSEAVITNNSGFYYQLRGHTFKSKVIATDVFASNGFIHVIDKIAWIPNFPNISSTSSIAGMRPDLERTSLNQGMTFIAPVNKAFEVLDSKVLEFLKTVQGLSKRRSILQHHVYSEKMDVIDMAYKRRILPQSLEVVEVSVGHRGAVTLDRTAKLIQTNIPASNGILHLSSALLIPSFVKPVIQNRCDSRVIYSRCRSCRTFVNDNCPAGTISTGQREKCRYLVWGVLTVIVYPGCKTKCTPLMKKCCPGFYGSSCTPCPGRIGEPCSGQGKCSDGIQGKGTCSCNGSATGSACELCQDKNKYGLSCNKTCECVHGTCISGRYGNGSCIPYSCRSNYFGLNCATRLKSCGEKIIPCSIHAVCAVKNNYSSCVCKSGYEGLGDSDCYEIDPCQHPKRGGCHPSAICTKTAPGENTCSCMGGWTGDGISCTPINYCVTTSRGFCHKYARCIFNGPGKVNCECLPGYQGDGKSCQEIHSCLINNGNCSPLAKCIRTGPGQNNCKCRFGFIGDGYICLPSISVVLRNRKELRVISRFVVKANLLASLSYQDSNLTLFVPSDNAMNSLNESLRTLLAVPEDLSWFLDANTVRGFYSTTDLRRRNRSRISSLSSSYINVSLSDANELVIGGAARIIVPNITASNGIIHIVDKVLLPLFLKPRKEVDLYQALCGLVAQNFSRRNFSEFCRFIQKYNLEGRLRNCTHCSLFVPDNNAFNKLAHSHYYNISRKDMLYHITNHYIDSTSVKDDQQFDTLAGRYYVLLLGKKHSEITVNDVLSSKYRADSRWIIYTIPSVLKATQNTCFSRDNRYYVTRCRPCYFARSCPPGYRYAGVQRCFYGITFGISYRYCKTLCFRITEVRKCCPGFFGHQCYACPGGGSNPCFGHGKCNDTETGNGYCACQRGYTGIACERCKEGRFGEKCTSCGCQGNASCDVKTGFCRCPPDRKGVKCEQTALNSSCGNYTCHQHASCRNNVSCLCDSGFTGNGTSCSYIDLCANNGGCSPNAKCSSASGTRKCTCNVNYEGNGYYCRGKNLCLESSTSCHPKAECVYLRPGRDKCVCNAGYSGDGRRTCTRVNRCSLRNGGCSVTAFCSYNWTSDKTSCKCRDGYLGNGTVCVGNLVESLQNNPVLTKFYSRFQSSIVQEILSPEAVFTLIAPNNEAFTPSRKRKRRSVTDLSESDLQHYVVSCVSINKEDVVATGRNFTSVAGSLLKITSPRVINYNVKIISVQETTSGSILIVDKLIGVTSSNVSNSSMSFIEAAKSNGYELFLQLLTVASMLDVVSSPYYQPFTMFWPTDEAIARLPSDIRERLLGANYTDELRSVLNYHVISKTKMTAKDILSYSGGLSRRTQEGASLYISCKGQQGNIFINDRSKIVHRDIAFREGIAFGVSEVLLPPGVGGRCDEIIYEEVNGSCVVCNNTGLCPPGAILQSVNKLPSCVIQGSYLGCLSRCKRRKKLTKCCKNFYGPDCQACPGGVGNACKRRGSCNGGITGNGTCHCHGRYRGTACELCPSDLPSCHIVPRVCSTRKNPCSLFAVCDDDDPKLCRCMPRYEGDGFYCQEIDKCQKNNGNCSEHAICTYLGPDSAKCRCRSGYYGDGHTCTALTPSHPCRTNNGNCHVHAQCIPVGMNAQCKCREGFVGDGIQFCEGTLLEVLYDVEDLSEFTKFIRKRSFGVEGNDLVRLLSSELDHTVFAPVNYGFTVKKMNIYELKNHIVQGKVLFKAGTRQTYLSLAGNNITVVMSKNKRGRVNNIANMIGDYPAINGIVHVIDHVLPYMKPPTTAPPTFANTNTKPTRPSTKSLGTVSASHDKNHTAKVVGVVFGVLVIVVIIVVIVILVKRRRRTTAVKYNKNMETILFESEPYTEEDHVDDDDYEHPELKHPSSETRHTFIQNPTYMATPTDSDEHLEMTESSSIVPLTQHDANTFGKDGKA